VTEVIDLPLDFKYEGERAPVRSNDVLNLLRARYTVDAGNGPRYVFAPEVRNAAGFDATRSFDAVVVDTWPSSGLTVHIFEIKVTRSDWLRELKTPAKTQAALDRSDLFTVVAPAGVVKLEELGEGWGLVEVKNGKLRTVVAPANRSALGWDGRYERTYNPIPRSFAVALMRSVSEPGWRRQCLDLRESNRRLLARLEIAEEKLRAAAVESLADELVEG
jgi:hypothetical protein